MPEGLSQSINQVIKYHITILKLKISKHDLWHNLEHSLDCLIPFPNKKDQVMPNTDILKKKKFGKQAGPEAPLTIVYIVEGKPLVTLLSFKLINKLKAKNSYYIWYLAECDLFIAGKNGQFPALFKPNRWGRFNSTSVDMYSLPN